MSSGGEPPDPQLAPADFVPESLVASAAKKLRVILVPKLTVLAFVTFHARVVEPFSKNT